VTSLKTLLRKNETKSRLYASSHIPIVKVQINKAKKKKSNRSIPSLLLSFYCKKSKNRTDGGLVYRET